MTRLASLALLLLACARPAPPLDLVDERRHEPPQPGLLWQEVIDHDGAALVAMFRDIVHEKSVFRLDAAGARRLVGPLPRDWGYWFPQMVAVSGAISAVALRDPARVVVDDGGGAQRTLAGRPGEGAASALLVADGLLFVGGAGDLVRVFRLDGTEVATVRPEVARDDTAFGSTLAYAGGVLVVGEPAATFPASAGMRGRAHVYRRAGDSFRHVGSIDTGGEELARAVATDGTWVAVGDPYAAVAIAGGGKGIGRVHLYRLEGERLLPEVVLHDLEPGNWAVFGADVALSGGRLAVGAPGTASDPRRRPGAVRVYERCGDHWVEALVYHGGRPASGFARRVFLHGDALAFQATGAVVTGRLVGGCRAPRAPT